MFYWDSKHSKTYLKILELLKFGTLVLVSEILRIYPMSKYLHGSLWMMLLLRKQEHQKLNDVPVRNNNYLIYLPDHFLKNCLG